MKSKVYKHITISEADETHNDKLVYIVVNTKKGDPLEYIYYEPSWKQYVLTTINDIIFSVSCLENIIDFIKNEIKK
jgi:hypothetical protein